MIARYTHSNWATEAAGNITIKRVGSEGVASKPYSAAGLTERIKNATSMAKRQGTFWPDFADKISWLPDNTLISFRPTGEIGILGQYNSVGHYDLKEDEALIIKLPELESDYNGLHTMNYWAASPDWVNKPAYLGAVTVKHKHTKVLMVTAEQRKQQIMQRQQHAAARYQTW